MQKGKKETKKQGTQRKQYSNLRAKMLRNIVIVSTCLKFKITRYYYASKHKKSQSAYKVLMAAATDKFKHTKTKISTE